MPEDAPKRCLVAVDSARGPLLFEVSLPAGADVAAALAAARSMSDVGGAGPAVDWDGAQVGIWGTACHRSSVPREGDRIELYRPLRADPRQQRRARLRAGKS